MPFLIVQCYARTCKKWLRSVAYTRFGNGIVGYLHVKALVQQKTHVLLAIRFTRVKYITRLMEAFHSKNNGPNMGYTELRILTRGRAGPAYSVSSARRTMREGFR